MVIGEVTGTPDWLFTPETMLIMCAAGRPPMSTVTLQFAAIAPVNTGPATASPISAVGSPPISTVGAHGPVITSDVAVMSVCRAAGKGMTASLYHGRALRGMLGSSG